MVPYGYHMVPLCAGMHHLKLYNDWYMMVHKVTGLELYREGMNRAALKCDCKMFFHQLQCLHVWLVMHVEGYIDLDVVCKALPRRNKVSKERLSLAPLFSKGLCARCDAEVAPSAKKKKKKNKKKGKNVEGGGGKSSSTFVGKDVEAERVARQMSGGTSAGEKRKRGEGSGRGALLPGGGRITHILPDDPIRDHGLR